MTAEGGMERYRWQVLVVGVLNVVFATGWLLGWTLAQRDARRDALMVPAPVDAFDQVGDEVYRHQRRVLEARLEATTDAEERAYLEGQLRWLDDLKARHDTRMAEARQQREQDARRRTLLITIQVGSAVVLGFSGAMLLVLGLSGESMGLAGLILVPVLLGGASLYTAQRVSPAWTHVIVKALRLTRQGEFPDVPMLRNHRQESAVRDVGFAWTFVHSLAGSVLLLTARRRPRRRRDEAPPRARPSFP